MKFSILINTHNQRNYLLRCINSCLNQSYKGKYEIIICDTSLKSNSDIIKKIKKKKLFYYHKKKFSIFPVIDQLFKIHFAFKKSKGQFILLLDGDDFFDKRKLYLISKFINQKEIVYHDLPIYYFKKKGLKKNSEIIFFKKFYFYKKFFNNWPTVYGTSCLFLKREILKKFFLCKRIYDFNYLAIDIKLALFAQKFFNYKIINHKITFKYINNKSLDKNFNNFFSKAFWKRRNQQIEYQKYLEDNYINLNFIIIKIINFFLNKIKI